MSDAAPYFSDVARGPTGEACQWLRAADGTRLRLCLWPLEGAKGTVLIFPGRTEYVEKYSDMAREFAARGYASAAIDWRGQGLSDRVDAARRLGHVDDFAEYQEDVRAMRAAIQAAQMPGPLFLVAHSMGGCIGLRALHLGLPVRAAVFTGPMWGLGIPVATQIGGRVLSWLAVRTGMSQRYAPTKAADAEPAAQPFANNLLTTDPQMYEWMQDQVRRHPELFLGGVSLGWLRAAFQENDALGALKSPDIPCECWLGTAEKIVSQQAIKSRMADWPKGELIWVEGAEHEVAMERPETRARLFDRSAALFDAAL